MHSHVPIFYFGYSIAVATSDGAKASQEASQNGLLGNCLCPKLSDQSYNSSFCVSRFDCGLVAVRLYLGRFKILEDIICCIGLIIFRTLVSFY